MSVSFKVEKNDGVDYDLAWFDFGAASSHPYAAEQMAAELEDEWISDEMRFAVARNACLAVITYSKQKKNVEKSKAQIYAKAGELGLNIRPAECLMEEESVLRLENIRALALRWLARESGGTLVNFDGKNLVALNLDAEYLINSDRHRENMKSKSPLLECASIRIQTNDNEFILSIETSILRCGKFPLKLMEKLATRGVLRKIDPDDEDFCRTACYVLPNMSTAMRIVDLTSGPSNTLLTASQRRGFDRWRPTSPKTEATFWSRLSEIKLSSTQEIQENSHALLLDQTGQPYFIPVPRVLLVGQVVLVPAASKIFAKKIETRVVQLLSTAPWLKDFKILSSCVFKVNKDEDTKALVAKYQEYFKRELENQTNNTANNSRKRTHATTESMITNDEANNMIQPNVEELKRAKLARKLARQQERERRKMLKARKKNK